MLDPDWLARKHSFCHITLRDIDVPDFDVAQLIGDLQRLHIEIATLFAGGYVAIYPTALAVQRTCPGLDGRDLYGEIVAAAADAGVTIIPCIDIGEIPMSVARARPELAAVDHEGRVIEKSAVTAKPCSLGPWIHEVAGEILDELVDRYAIRAIKWAGASYNGTPMGCHCAHCRERYRADRGKDLPTADFAADAEYTTWRVRVIQEGVEALKRQAAARGLTVVGNNVWHLGRSKNDICAIAEQVDIAQIEIQSRFYHWREGERSRMGWERFGVGIESTRYVSAVSRNPPWVVASYFLAWPWRWSGVPAAEQFLYLAQVLANGGCPGVNFTTGAPHQHYDQRTMHALERLFGMLQRHPEVYQGDATAAEVAIVYDHASALADRDRGSDAYMAELAGIAEVLDRSHIPYDIVSADRHQDFDPDRHRALIVPDAQALSAENAAFLLDLEAQGVGGVWTGAPGRVYGAQDWWSRIGVASLAPAQWFLSQEETGPCQAYASVLDGAHALVRGIEAPVLAMSDRYWPVRAAPDAQVVLARLPTFRLFPEGQAYPDTGPTADALALVTGRQVSLPLRAGLQAEQVSHPDHARLVVNALALASGGGIAPMVRGRPGLRLSRRRLADGRLAIHAINTTGHHRFIEEFTPLHEVAIAVPPDTRRVVRMGDGTAFAPDDGRVAIPVIEAYDVFLVEPGDG